MRTRCEMRNGSCRGASLNRRISFTSANACVALAVLQFRDGAQSQYRVAQFFRPARCGSKIVAGNSLVVFDRKARIRPLAACRSSSITGSYLLNASNTSAAGLCGCGATGNSFVAILPDALQRVRDNNFATRVKSVSSAFCQLPSLGLASSDSTVTSCRSRSKLQADQTKFVRTIFRVLVADTRTAAFFGSKLRLHGFEPKSASWQNSDRPARGGGMTLALSNFSPLASHSCLNWFQACQPRQSSSA